MADRSADLQYVVRPDAPQLEQYAAIAHQAFVMNQSLLVERFAYLADDTKRIVTLDGRVAGGLIFLDDAHRFAGQNIRTWAVALVAVAPESRGHAVGRTLMTQTLRHAFASDVPLCSLFASTPAFYRRLGFDVAGLLTHYQLPIAKLPVTPTDAIIERITDTSNIAPELAAYTRAIEHAHGPFALTDAELRRRVFSPYHLETHPYRIRFPDSPPDHVEGYLIFEQDRANGLLRVHRQAIATPRAALAALTFLAEHRTLCREVTWLGAPACPLRLLTPSNAFSRTLEDWYLRIVNVESALRQRGYPPVHCELHLDIADDIIPQNAGRYVLTLRNGAPTVQRGGSGRISLHVRALAPIFSSHLSPLDLHAAGQISAPPDDLASLTLAFAGPQPYLLDRF